MVRTQIGMRKGPGPGKYLLPPLVGFKEHDPSKFRNPQYSMGLKLPLIKKDLGPGPKYNTEMMTTYGKAGPPAYSLASRARDLSKYLGPGPAGYNIQNTPRMKEPRPPAYSMSYRHDLKRSYETPGPNNYDVPTTLGPKVPHKHTSGAYSMSHRYPIIEKQKSPGPAKYDPTAPNTYKNKLPAYSMSIKTKGASEKNPYPSPANYHPQLAKKGGYSFGLKTDNAPYITADDEMPCINR